VKVILNIGLDGPTYLTDLKKRNRVQRMQEAAAALLEVGPAYFEVHDRKHGKEPTLVVVIETPHKTHDGLHAWVDVLANSLGQDCIAFATADYHDLAGPMAVRWLPFCHSAFIYPKENVL
jgi:hypothetical protein